MKKLFLIALLILVSDISFGQFKGYDDKGNYKQKQTGNLLFGFINPNNFSMRHSFNVSMMTMGTGNVSVTSYINSMNYRFSDKLNISADVKFQYSPYASSSLGNSYASALQKDLSGISLSRASLNYKISDNAFINFQYRKYDQTDYYNNYNNPFFYNSGYNGYYNNGW